MLPRSALAALLLLPLLGLLDPSRYDLDDA